MRPQRTVSQLLDNANKSAIHGFPLSEVGPRLSEAWTGDENRLRYYDQSQHCIELCRGYCLQHGLLDASLVFEIFNRHLLGRDEFWLYFTERYRHIIVDSVEEMVPIAHDLIARLLPQCDSAVIGGDLSGFHFLGRCGGLRRSCPALFRALKLEIKSVRWKIWRLCRTLRRKLGRGDARFRTVAAVVLRQV